MYDFIRLIICVFFVGMIFLTLKKTLPSRFKKIIIIAICCVVCTITVAIPFENALVTFPSFEKTFDYSKNGEIISVSDAHNSSAAIYMKDDYNYSIFFAKKAKDGYKLCSLFDSRKIYQTQKDSFTISIYKIEFSSDYYIQIFGISSEIPKISDNLGTEFDVVCLENEIGMTINCISNINYNENYKMYLNGVEVELR